MVNRRAEAKARKSLVSKEGMQPQLDAFAAASGAEKAARGALLNGWLTSLNHQRAVQPPARVALEEVGVATKALPDRERRRVELLEQLGALIDQDAPVTASTVKALESWRPLWPQGDERWALTTYALDTLEAPGRDVDYDASHALYNLRLANERERETPQGERAL
jgi:hypothetical protein